MRFLLCDSDITPDRPHKDYNLELWGTTSDTNILWITGISGSGKSTLADYIAKETGADIIRIDFYTFDDPDDYDDVMSADFNQYLDEHLPDWRDIQRSAAGGGSEAGMWFDTLEAAIKAYGAEMFEVRRVIAEGVQLLDETLFYNNKQELCDQPVIVMTTSMKDSVHGIIYRDQIDLDTYLHSGKYRQLQRFDTYKTDLLDVLGGNSLP